MRVLDQLCTKLGWVWFTLSSLNALENEPPIAMSMAILKSFVSKESQVCSTLEFLITKLALKFWIMVLQRAHDIKTETTNLRILYFCNQFKSATLLSATHECTPKIWSKHERHSFQNWRVQIERQSFLGISEVKDCTPWKSLRTYIEF